MGSEVIDHQVVGVSFGFYSAAELVALSVCPVTNPHTFDALHQPVPGGLYDERMGPLDPHDRCRTCHQQQTACLGHMGHISLTLPVYHPVLFDLCYKLMKAQCWFCHRLKLSRTRVQRVTTKLQLIEAGMLHQAQQLDELDVLKGNEANELKKATAERKRKEKERVKKEKQKSRGKSSSANKRKSQSQPSNSFVDDEAEEGEDEDEDEDGGDEAPLDLSSTSSSSRHSQVMADLHRLSTAARHTYDRHVKLYGHPPPLTSAALEYRSSLLSTFLRDIQQRRCHNCGGFSPRLRKDGHNKIFRLPLVKKEQQANDLNRLTLDSLLTLQRQVEDDLPGMKGAQQRHFDQEAQLIQSIKGREAGKGQHRSRGGGAGQKGKATGKGKKDESVKGKGKRSRRDDDDSDAESGESSDDDDNDDDRSSDVDEAGGVDMDRSLVADDSRALDSEIELAADNRRVPILMFPTEVERHLERLWKEESAVLHHLWGSLFNQPRLAATPSTSTAGGMDHSMFFLRVLSVPPSRFRPPSLLNGVESDHPHNAYLKAIIEADTRIRKMAHNRPQRLSLPSSSSSSSSSSASQPISGASVLDWGVLIESWLGLQDQVNVLLDSSKSSQPNAPQDGIRQTFEKKEGLFRRNMMGKRVNFAARSVISPDPFINTNEIGVPEMFATQLTFPEPVTSFNVESLREAVINGPDVHPGANAIEDERGQLISLAHKSPAQRLALSKTLLTRGTTHKGGHAALTPLQCKRVLRHIRNGDVMLVNRQPTLHKPSMMTHRVRVLKGRNKMWQTIRMHYATQNFVARAEAYTISNTDHQYLVPTDGSPLRGLIQDNVLTGVLLTELDTFLTRAQFQQLLFCCVEIDPTLPLPTPRPAILKPVELFAGKQVIASLLNLLTHGRPPLNLVSKGKVPVHNWAQHKEEAQVIIRQNELVTGVLDKSQFGDAGYGLVHAVYELYGAATAGQLLSTLGRLFTLYLQTQAFTCGIDDMLIVERSEHERKGLIQSSVVTGLETACEFASVQYDPQQPLAVNSALQKMLRDTTNTARLDGAMKGALNPFTSQIIGACLPSGQLKSFPFNGMSLMTLSGAKGSAVNFSQISCLLGQQELEGKRVPQMATGKTLPSFRRYDPAPRAGGYVTDRFLTGIRPQEYYFHCMAGREGLIDTAVKTSRSGYLQRCLIKHLESLTVNYDYTVRDSDASIVQFHYGDDSIDIGRTAYLDRFSFLTSNWKAVLHKLNPPAAIQALDTRSVESFINKERKSKEEGEIDPVLSKFSPGAHLGAVSEQFRDAMALFIKEDPDRLFNPTTPPSSSSPAGRITPEKFTALMQLNYLYSLVQPGESVGILAAQSVGEPSTQMTLNTFHLAGHGGANVTLGIPRLREIIMTASAHIRTPIMEVPLLSPKATRVEAEEVAARLNRLSLHQFLTSAQVKESVDTTERGASYRLYSVRLSFPVMSSPAILSHRLTFSDFEQAFAHQFCVKLNAHIKKEVKLMHKSHAVTPVIQAGKRSTDGAMVNDRDESDMGGRMKGRGRGELDEDAVTVKERNKRHENASYDAPDEEDLEIIRNEEKEKQRQEEEDDDDEEDKEEHKRLEHKYNDDEEDGANGRGGAGSDEDEDEEGMGDGVSDSSSLWLSALLNRCPYLRTITFDPKQTWAEVVVAVSLSLPKLLMMSIVEGLVEGVLLRSTPNISRAFVIEKQVGGLQGVKTFSVGTDGVNFTEMAYYGDVLDLTRLYSNDIAAIHRQFGVEAARAAITSEVQSVFAPYGISVDYRHLSLIADYMTVHGDYRPLNRGGIDSNTSTFQKISFETSMQFLREAALMGDTDYLQSPSSCIVMGKPVNCGTGAFQLMQPLPAIEE